LAPRLSAFAEQAAALASAGPDAIFIETMNDISEARCAVLAAKSVTDLPVFASCTFGLGGRMDLSGTDPETAAVVLEAAGADAVGMNCGLGPEQMLPLLQRVCPRSTPTATRSSRARQRRWARSQPLRARPAPS
jgi:5-methyltetrahydrofolate--homocysteine methyltransferase